MLQHLLQSRWKQLSDIASKDMNTILNIRYNNRVIREILKLNKNTYYNRFLNKIKTEHQLYGKSNK